MSFHLDGMFSGTFAGRQLTSGKQIAFSGHNMSMNQQHTLVIQNGDAADESASDLFLDSIIVTCDFFVIPLKDSGLTSSHVRYQDESTSGKL
jgi:hypothetical protein